MEKLVIDIIKDIAFFLINGVRKFVYFFCLLFPIDKHKVFVNYFDGKGIGDHPKYIIRELLKKRSDDKSILGIPRKRKI